MDPSVREFDLLLSDGRTLHAYERPPQGGPARLNVYWHHGSPNIGAPPEPLFALSDELGIRWLGHDRPGYGGSTPLPDRRIGTVANDAGAVADALEATRFAVAGSSGGGPNALACAALLEDRVSAVLSISGPAPYDPGAESEFFAGMGDPGPLRAATRGRAARERYEQTTTPAEPPFTQGDWAALQGDWSWLMEVVMPALASGPAPLIEDDLALVGEWGFSPGRITQPVRILHGGADLMVPPRHAHRLSELMPGAELEIAEGEGHVSVLSRAPAGLRWLADAAAGE